MSGFLNNTIILSDSLEDSSRELADQIVIDIWLLFSVFTGVAGNVYVLYATNKFGAIRIDDMSLWFINNLAITDIISTVVMVVPVTIVNLSGNRWIFGDFLCIIIAFVSRIPFIANILLIVGLSINKLYRVSFPLRSLDMSNKTKRFWLTNVLTLAIINPFLGLFFNNFTATIQYNGMASVCRLIKEGFVVVVVRLLFYILVPSIILVITNIALIIIAFRKTQSSVNKRNIVVVLGVTLQFLIAFIPYTLVLSIAFFIPVQDWLVRGAFSLLYTACWFNPLVYYLNNPRFKEFTNNWLRGVFEGMGRCGSCQFSWKRTYLYRMLVASPNRADRVTENETELFELSSRGHEV